MMNGAVGGRPIRALHVIPSIAAQHGGPSFAIRGIARALATAGVEVTIVTTDDDGLGKHLGVSPGTQVEEAGAKVLYFRRNLLPYKVSISMGQWLFRNAKSFDVLHLHALFSFSSTIAAHAARRARVPYIVRPLGVLNRWGLENRRRLPKQLSLRAIELPIIRHAVAMHYTSEAERAEACEISPIVGRARSAVIPLPIETPAKGDANFFRLTYPEATGRRVVLFLSRVDKKKGIEPLLQAFAEVQRAIPATVLAIAGTGDAAYVDSLRQMAGRLGLTESILWTGHISGELKAAAFAVAEIFVLPSSSENFGVAAAEALALGVPAILSDAVALSAEARAYEAAVVVDQTPASISAGILEVLNHPARAAQMAANGERLAAELYSPTAVGRSLRELYESILAGQSSADAFTSTPA